MKKFLALLFICSIALASSSGPNTSGSSSTAFSAITGSATDNASLSTALDGKANETLSDLASPTAFNQNLLFAASKTIGAASASGQPTAIYTPSVVMERTGATSNYMTMGMASDSSLRLTGFGSATNVAFQAAGTSDATMTISGIGADANNYILIGANLSGTGASAGTGFIYGSGAKSLTFNLWTTVRMDDGFAINSSTVDLTADDQTLTLTSASNVRLTSNNATAANRTIILGDGDANGQVLILQWDEDTSTGQGELPDATANNVRLSAAWSMDGVLGGQYDTLSLVWNSTDSNWIETARSNN